MEVIKIIFEELSGVYLNTCAGTLFSCCCAVDAKMARKYGEGLHDEAMTRLCFVCTDLIKGKPFEVEKHIDLLTRALKTPEIFIIPDVTPYNFCKKCELALKRVVDKESVKSSRLMQEWGECGENCSSCLLVAEKKGGRRKKKVSYLVLLRYSHSCMPRL